MDENKLTTEEKMWMDLVQAKERIKLLEASNQQLLSERAGMLEAVEYWKKQVVDLKVQIVRMSMKGD